MPRRLLSSPYVSMKQRAASKAVHSQQDRVLVSAMPYLIRKNSIAGSEGDEIEGVNPSGTTEGASAHSTGRHKVFTFVHLAADAIVFKDIRPYLMPQNGRGILPDGSSKHNEEMNE